MKKFIKKLCIMSLPLVALLIVNALYKNTNYWKAENGVYKFEQMPSGIELACLGNSHYNYGLKFEDYPEYVALNMAVNAQSYDWDYLLLKYNIQKFQENAVILIPVDIIQIIDTQALGDFSRRKPRYYRFLPPNSFIEWNVWEFLKFSVFPILSAKDPLWKITHDLPDEAVDVFQNYTTPKTGELAEIAESKYKGYISSMWDKNKTSEESFLYNQNLASQLIELCLEHNLRPVLISAPVTDALSAEFVKHRPEFFAYFERFSRELQQKYPTVPYFDYLSEPTFSAHHTYFWDSDHLNAYGAKVFTARVISDLREAGLLE